MEGMDLAHSKWFETVSEQGTKKVAVSLLSDQYVHFSDEICHNYFQPKPKKVGEKVNAPA
jgi:hypothetical protein